MVWAHFILSTFCINHEEALEIALNLKDTFVDKKRVKCV